MTDEGAVKKAAVGPAVLEHDTGVIARLPLGALVCDADAAYDYVSVHVYPLLQSLH